MFGPLTRILQQYILVMMHLSTKPLMLAGLLAMNTIPKEQLLHKMHSVKIKFTQ